jgi:hypothetical protein
MDKLNVLNSQLKRMRQMNRYYHQQFLTDVRLLLGLTVLMLTFRNTLTPYLIPFISLFGAVLLSFHAHYLIFSRNFSEYLERKINNLSEEKIMIAHELENTYFFPIQSKKIVVAGLGKSFSWFGFVTLFITTYGVGLYIYGLLNINLSDSFNYLLVLIGATVITLSIGVWWFVLGEGEKRLSEVFRTYE